MKSLFVLSTCLLLLSFQSVKSQALKLDERNGFKSIKLGDNLEKYFNSLSEEKQISEDKLVSYIYSPSNRELYNVFDFTFDEITLFFSTVSNKLIGISLFKKYAAMNNSGHYKSALDGTSTLIDNFDALLDNTSVKFANDKDGSVGATWTGLKLFMKLTTSYQGLNVGSESEILIFNRAFLKSKFESGF